MEGDRPLLEVEGLQAYYGLSHVLHAVSLRVAAGEAVAVLGRNGAGKTTTLKAIAGVLQPRGGRIRFGSEDITGLPPYEIVKRRISWVPEERRIFPNLTVYENLKMSRLVVDGRPPQRLTIQTHVPSQIGRAFSAADDLNGTLEAATQDLDVVSAA